MKKRNLGLDKCPKTMRTISCKYGGFPHPRNCSRCLCPGGYGGDDCSQRPNDGCGEKMKTESEWHYIMLDFSNPNAEDYLDLYRKCTYWIMSPRNTRVQIYFHAEYFRYKMDGCGYAGVEIKTNVDQTLTGYSEKKMAVKAIPYLNKTFKVFLYIDRDKTIFLVDQLLYEGKLQQANKPRPFLAAKA
ncbi:hypothetical protein OESDEN_06577 [Oesophagostomum dentatum]|uniref:CUB domain-containing protein n=1 Tax=Oesophagostomum dentatum TaxID=61180 RepID=A0A0B1T8D7_OESDE|nr:hypothetical protein OESDEN_06577 [Oesophagostomum dentatum]